MVKIGIIGGSGLDDPNLIENYTEKEITTPYGNPSSKLTCGKINGVEVVIIARHGKNHEIYPTKVNYRANIHALKQEGCTHILATSAVGSLKEEIKPGHLVFPDQFIDQTKLRKLTFSDQYGDVRHISSAEPFSKELRQLLIEETKLLNYNHHTKATIVVIEGPRFSTKAESHMFRNFADIIGMTTCPEAQLAVELEIPYASIAMSTDYDCWKEDEFPVTFEMVMQTMKQNAEKVKTLLTNVIPKIAKKDQELIKSKIRTIPNFPKPGIMFRDITTLLLDPEGMKKTINILYNRYKDKNLDAIAGIEARGFIIAGILANKLGIGLIPIRKPNKLPYETISHEYQLEYGTDKVEIHKDAIKPNQNILLVDDLVATAGTALASALLIEKLEGKIEEIAFIIELDDLGGREKLEKKGHKVFSVINFQDSG
jgi:5'-methylthioadenosine phosphorylase